MILSEFLTHGTLSLLLLAAGAHGWSSECHATIAYLAGTLLDDSESQYLHQLMGWETSESFRLADHLAGISMEADSAEWDQYKYYHYAHALPNFATPWEKATMCGHSQNPTVCVVTGIAIWTSKAAKTYLPLSERQFAIKMITHLIGDIHQPLHIGLWKDLGGLKIEKVWKSYNPYREYTHYNLHELWDRGLFRHYEVKGMESGSISRPNEDMFIDSDDDAEDSDPGWKILAKELLEPLNRKLIKSFKIPDPDRDTRDLSRSGQAVRLPKHIAAETIKNVRDYAYTDEKGRFIKSGVGVSEAYMDSRVEIMKGILTKAGVRLADLLKHIIRFSIESDDAELLATELAAVTMDSQTSESTVGEPEQDTFEDNHID